MSDAVFKIRSYQEKTTYNLKTMGTYTRNTCSDTKKLVGGQESWWLVLNMSYSYCTAPYGKVILQVSVWPLIKQAKILKCRPMKICCTSRVLTSTISPPCAGIFVVRGIKLIKRLPWEKGIKLRNNPHYCLLYLSLFTSTYQMYRSIFLVSDIYYAYFHKILCLS